MSSLRKRPRLMERALRLAESGWYVFPLRPRDKRPAVRFTNWETRATRDPDLIYRWWHDAPYNIAIATGPSKLLVVDCDTGKGKSVDPRSGLEVLMELAQRGDHELPNTLQVRTPTGGRHLHFTAPEHPVLGNTAGKLGRHIDTRGIGGYVVAAGSVRPEGYYTVINKAPVAPLPRWLIDSLLLLVIQRLNATRYKPSMHTDTCEPS